MSYSRQQNMHRASYRRGGTAGFTLIELMYVVLVIGILAAIAYPNYQDQVRKSRRGQAKADMVEYAQQAERFHTVQDTYVNWDTALNLRDQSPREAGAQSRYTLGYASTASTFLITATPVGPQAQDTCGTLTINQAGVKTNSAGNLGDCW